MKAGILGYSEGNGHPFSFSAIINGYEPEEFVNAGWSVILDYLEKQPRDAFDFHEVEVSHAWTQDINLTNRLCAASKIPHAVEHYTDMLGKVDFVFIARDDYHTHFPMAKPFLEHGTPVFVDKPLTLNEEELNYFEPYLHNGMLMSTSGMRYAKELDTIRNNNSELGELKLIEGVILNNLEKYGIHLLDAINGLGIKGIKSIIRLPSSFEAYSIELDNGIQFNLSCLGSVTKTLHLSLYGTKNHFHFDLYDNFSAFKRTIGEMIHMVKTKSPVILPEETINNMNLIRRAKFLNPMEKITFN
ncbi:Gfo/Idh/MocA family oxidoreductase [Legionella worsleiensis]|uniref:Putative oxidoreductase n=1 Tax=Legionella worsleiensis TaxID=45076 RepID=A0A0W1A3K3_9GAMM|nr:Gfo/Idh/MocA family oxidoreductase [Legionella worsleiensis]KTD75878.1 putative oxidoreductase [Legionella worsleiensis]STY32891.1 Oxidoreductase family, NAD-binding Rossmann fold [Legionella worsleiensis]